jgi:hypothetical protein
MWVLVPFSLAAQIVVIYNFKNLFDYVRNLRNSRTIADPQKQSFTAYDSFTSATTMNAVWSFLKIVAALVLVEAIVMAIMYMNAKQNWLNEFNAFLPADKVCNPCTYTGLCSDPT